MGGGEDKDHWLTKKMIYPKIHNEDCRILQKETKLEWFCC